MRVNSVAQKDKKIKKIVLSESNISQKGSVEQAGSNQAMLKMLGASNGTIIDLEEQMRSRIQQQFLQRQIPSAEKEADQLASQVGEARTPEQVKEQMGKVLHADFSGVRFHEGQDARAKAENIGARAYTSGRDVYFGEGGFDPAVAAHELVHTAQQGAVPAAGVSVSAPAGGIQMLPSLWSGLKKAGHAVMKGLVAAKEFVGGKMKLVGRPGLIEKAVNTYKAAKGDYSRTARMSSIASKFMTSRRKKQIESFLKDNPDMTAEQIAEKYGGNAKKALDPFNRRALSKIAKSKSDYGEKVRNALEIIDQRMMVDTMMGPSQEDRQRLIEHYKNYDDQALLQQEYDLSQFGKIYLGTDRGWEGYKETQELMKKRKKGEKRTDEDAKKLAAKDEAQARGSGDALARMMFLMQLGDFQRTDEKKGKRKWYAPWKRHKTKESREWDQTMANAFSHGGRTGFIFGATEESDQHGSSDDVANAIFGTDLSGELGEDSVVKTREAGTHHIAMPGKDAGKEGYKEHHGAGAFLKAYRDPNYRHFGMDMAIGGIGKEGGAGAGGRGQMINAQGRSGHMYIGKASSSADRKGGLLVGLESDSPYRMNQTGHMHNAAAAAEEASSTGGLKKDIQGAKYGGRTVDLSALKNQEVYDILQHFTSYMENMRSDESRKDEYP